MSRLIGKKINLALYTSLGFLFVVISAIALEYFGIVNYIPSFGKEIKTDNTSSIHSTLTNQ